MYILIIMCFYLHIHVNIDRCPKSILNFMLNCVATCKYLPCSYSSFLGKTAPSFFCIYIYACNLKFVKFFLLQYLRGKKPEQNECIINEKRHSTKFYTIRKNVELLRELFFSIKSSNSNAF